MIKIQCTKLEQTLLKRSIKANECKGIACDYKELCEKPEDMTCGQYVVGLIEWEVVDELEA